MSKVVIVTGASGGLGAEIAIQFGLIGTNVVINDIACLDEAGEIAKKINETGKAFVYKADVCQYQEVRAMVEDTLQRWGSIDVLVNNAGGSVRWLGSKGQLIIEMEEAAWDSVIDVNLKGTFICIKAVAPYMIKQRGGHIINISSGHGLRGAKSFSAYSAAKAGVIGLTKSAARELGEYNIKVNALCPGLILHERSVREGRVSQERIDSYMMESLLHRTGAAQQFAEFVVHLSSMENISGQTLNLDSRILF